MNRREFVVAGSLSFPGVAFSKPIQITTVAPGLIRVQQPRAVPAFSLADVDGKTVRSGDLLGNVLILRFWATW